MVQLRMAMSDSDRFVKPQCPTLVLANSDRRKVQSEAKLNKSEPFTNSTSPANNRAEGRRHLPYSVTPKAGIELHCPWDIPRVGETGEELLCLAQLVPVQNRGEKRIRKGRGSKYSVWVVDLQARRVAAMLEQLDMVSGQHMQRNKALTDAFNKARSKGWGVQRDKLKKTKNVEVDMAVDSCGDICSSMEYWGWGAQDSVWGRWGLTRRMESNSESFEKNLSGFREIGNKTSSIKNKDTKSKVNFKSKGKRKTAPGIKGTIKNYFVVSDTRQVEGGGGQNAALLKLKTSLDCTVLQKCTETK